MALKIKHKLYTTIILMTGLMFSTAQLQAGDLYYGFKLAYFNMDTIAVDDPDNAGLVIGYDWDNNYGSLGLEGEFTTTFEDGKSATENVELDTAGIYGVYRTRKAGTRTMGPYLKLKAGAAYTDITLGNISEDGSSFSAGIGMGINMTAVSFELEYTKIADDIDMVNLLVRF